jgi:glyoxylase-like metal-dependent hydrolase (beta-lactamase superfamily II)
MKIAGYEIHPVETGRFALDGGAMFGIVPRVLWERTNPPDEANRIEMAMRCLLLRGHGRTVLVDAGVGTGLGRKEREIYRFEPTPGPLEASLRDLGVGREDVTDVILTHLHFDHAGGAVRREGKELVPAFPRATCHVQRRNFEWACDPSERDRASYRPDDFLPLRDAGCLSLVEGPTELLPGLHLEVVDGHTFGQQIVRVSDTSGTLLFCADLVPTASHVPLPYVMGYDLQPLVTLREKRGVYARAIEEGWILVLEHDATTEAVRVRSGRRGAEVQERLRLAGGGDEG